MTCCGNNRANDVSVEDELTAETTKWRDRLDDRLNAVKPVDADGADLLENARAYRKDADHFEDEADPVRAFDAIVWGWAFVEIGEDLGKIEQDG